MQLYRILTENINKNNTLKLAAKYFDGFTVFMATGYWKNIQEKSLIIEVLTDKNEDILKLAKDIKTQNKQESVLIQTLQNNSQFI